MSLTELARQRLESMILIRRSWAQTSGLNEKPFRHALGIFAAARPYEKRSGHCTPTRALVDMIANRGCHFAAQDFLAPDVLEISSYPRRFGTRWREIGGCESARASDIEVLRELVQARWILQNTSRIMKPIST